MSDANIVTQFHKTCQVHFAPMLKLVPMSTRVSLLNEVAKYYFLKWEHAHVSV